MPTQPAKEEVNPSSFGLKIRGQITDVKQTPKGFIASVSMGSSMCKVFTKENSLEYGQVYTALCSLSDSGNMLFERVRLT